MLPIAGFLRRHHSAISFLGAVLVFVTFFVKDWRREVAKDRIAELEKAIAGFESRRDHDEIMSALESVGEPISESTGDLYRSGAEETEGRAWDDFRRQAKSRIDPMFPNVDEVSQSLTSNHEVMAAKDEAYKQVFILDDKELQIARAFPAVLPSGGTRKASREEKEAASLERQAAKSFDSAKENYFRATFLALYREQRTRQGRFTLLTAWSITLFTLGGLLGLIGSLFDPSGKS